MTGTAAAAASLLTVMRTSSLPAWASAATWSAVASASAVSVLVMDWTTMGAAEPTATPPTSTLGVWRRGRPAEPLTPTSRWMSDQVTMTSSAMSMTKPGEVDEPLGGGADAVAAGGLDEGHGHAAAVHGREGQDVDDGQVGREQARPARAG